MQAWVAPRLAEGISVEDRTFDRLVRRLGGSLDRRTGLKGIFAGLTGILGISAAEANVARPPIMCRSTGMQCITGTECCSGRCLLKEDGTSRCARTTSNRKKKKKKSGGGGSAPVPPPDCTVCANGCPYSTIEEAILNAADGSEVTIYQGYYQPTNIVNAAESWSIKINKSLTVKACDVNTDAVTIRPEANKLLFMIANLDNNSTCQQAAIAVTLSGLILDATNVSGARAMSTGCTFTADGFKAIDCEVKGFDAQYAPISLLAGPVLIEDCDLHDNAADTYRGSVVHIAGTNVTIKDSRIYSNTSRTGSVTGGIVGNNGSGVLALTGSTEIRNNTMTNPYSQTQGGGVWVGVAQSPNWSVEGTVRIHDNTGASAGGGITAYTEPTAGSVVDNTTVYNNTATTCNNVYISSNSTCN